MACLSGLIGRSTRTPPYLNGVIGIARQKLSGTLGDLRPCFVTHRHTLGFNHNDQPKGDVGIVPQSIFYRTRFGGSLTPYLRCTISRSPQCALRYSTTS